MWNMYKYMCIFMCIFTPFGAWLTDWLTVYDTFFLLPSNPPTAKGCYRDSSAAEYFGCLYFSHGYSVGRRRWSKVGCSWTTDGCSTGTRLGKYPWNLLASPLFLTHWNLGISWLYGNPSICTRIFVRVFSLRNLSWLNHPWNKANNTYSNIDSLIISSSSLLQLFQSHS